MAKIKHKNTSNRNQCNLTSSEFNSPTASPDYPNTPEKQDLYLKFHLVKMIEHFKEYVNNSLKEI